MESNLPEFQGFPKIARWNREIIVTEKIDGTNGCICIEQIPAESSAIGFHDDGSIYVGSLRICVGSRSRWLNPKSDNFGFWHWAADHAQELAFLGPGTHFGEWWGSGIQRGYGLPKGEKRFSLFNVVLWEAPVTRPACCHCVPVLYQGLPEGLDLPGLVNALDRLGSFAAPDFMNPEGVVVYHTAANTSFKVTIKDDESPKGKAVASET